MNLGDRIYQLRKKKNMSQGELADLLEVSRQSISKWETNASVPELDKLVRLAEVFGVTLDQPVLGSAASPEASESPAPSEAVRPDATDDPPPPQNHTCEPPAPPESCRREPVYCPYDTPPMRPGVSPTQQTAGFIFLTVGILAALLLTVFGGWGAALIIAPPIVLCGVICLNCRRRAGLWCCWTLYLYVGIVFRMATSVSTALIYHLLAGRVELSMSVIVAFVYAGCGLALLIGTLVSFRTLRCPWNRRTVGLLLFSGGGVLLARLLPSVLAWYWLWLLRTEQNISALELPMFWYRLLLCLFDLVNAVSWAALLTVLAGRIRDWRRNRQQ